MIGGIFKAAAQMAAWGTSISATKKTAVWAAGKARAAATNYVRYAETSKKSGYQFVNRALTHMTGYRAPVDQISSITAKANKIGRSVLGMNEVFTSKLNANGLANQGIFKRVLKDELAALPINYTMYRIEKHKAVSAEDKKATSNFLKYYVGAPMVTSIGSGFVFEKYMQNFSTKKFAMGAVKRLGPNTSASAMNLTMSAITGANKIADRMSAMQRARVRLTESRGTLSVIGTTNPATLVKKFGRYYKDERMVAQRGDYIHPTSTATVIDKVLTDHKAMIERYKKQADKIADTNPGAAKAFENTTASQINSLTKERLESYRSNLSTSNGFVKFMNDVSAMFGDDARFKVHRKMENITPGSDLGNLMTGQMPTDEYSIGGRDFNFKRFGGMNLKNSAIGFATSGMTGTFLHLFGMRDFLKSKQIEHSLIGTVINTTRGVPLYLPMAYASSSDATSAQAIAGKILGVDDYKGADPKQRKMVDTFLESRMDVYRDHYGITDKTAQKDAFINSAAHGELLMNAGEMVIQKPGGEVSVMTMHNIVKNGKNHRIAKTFDIGFHEGERLKFLKMSTEQDTIPARLIRGHTGYQENKYYDKKSGRDIWVTHGPGKYGRVIDPEEADGGRSLVYKLKQALDIGYSENQSFFSTAMSIFRKHTDPRYPTTFFSKQYIQNPEFRKDVLKTGRSREDLVTFLRKQADDAALEFWIRGTHNSGGTEEFVNELKKSISTVDPKLSDEMTHAMIHQNMSAEQASENIKNFMNKVSLWDEGFTNNGIQRHFLQSDLDDLHRTHSLFFGKGQQNVMEIASGIASSKSTYYGGRSVNASKIDEYNTMVLRLTAGQFGSESKDIMSSIGMTNMDNIIDSINPLTNQQRSAWYAASHLSRAYHKISGQVRGAANATSDAALDQYILQISDVLEALASNNDTQFTDAYKDITGYYKKRLRYSAAAKWDQDHRLKYDVDMGAKQGIYLIPGKSGKFGFVGKESRNYDDTGRQIQIATGVMDASNIAVMSMFHAFNRASSEMMGIGFDESQISTPMQYFEKMFKQRIMPFTAAYLGYRTIDRGVDYTMDGTPLGEGVTPFVSNMFAGLRVASQGMMDLTGITTMSNYLEDMMPGSITSPLSGIARGLGPIAGGLSLGAKVGGPRGALTGGIIGSAVGALAGGGPLGIFGMWDISKSRREVVQELTGEREVAVRKGRWWELCVVPTTKIQTNRGIIEIKDATPGDIIFTHSGSSANIIDISYHTENVKISIKGSPFLTEDIECTPDHPILIYDNELKWIKAKDIHNGDLLAYPLQTRDKQDISIDKYISSTKPTLLEQHDTYAWYYRLQKTNTGTLSKSRSKPVIMEKGKLNLGFETGLIFGHYLGDGNIYRSGDRLDPRGIEIAFSLNEYNKAIDVRNAITKVFGIDAPIINDNHRNMIRIRCFNSIIGEIFYNIFNGTNKNIPSWMYKVESDLFYKGLVSGLIDSDGTISDNTRVRFDNTNINIIHLFWQSCCYLDMYGTIRCKSSAFIKLNGYKKCYELSLNSDDSIKFKGLIPSIKSDRIMERLPLNRSKSVLHSKTEINKITYLMFSVTETLITEETETFYDICVDHEDHSFLGLAVTYHNSPSAYEGGKINYFRPHIYALTRSDFKEVPGFKDSLFTEMLGNMAPDLYAMKNYYSRPYPVTAGLFSNIPVFSNMVDLVTSPFTLTKGMTLRGINMHEDDISPTYVQRTGEKQGVDPGDVATNFINNSGIFENTASSNSGIATDIAHLAGSITSTYSPPQLEKMPYTETPMERSSTEWALGETVEGIKDIVGLRGFMLGTAFTSMTGRSSLFDFAPEMASPVDISGFQREYWNMELGGILGASEVIRRYVPHRRNNIQMYNPIRNTYPTWMPGYDYYQDFQHGDPYTQIQLGEARLPGPGYESLHDVSLTLPVVDEILGESVESQAAYYLGLPDYMFARNKDTDIAKEVAIQVVTDAQKAGELLTDARTIYDPGMDISATVDATIRRGPGGMTPVKVVPMGYGGESSLNAFLALSNTETGMLIEVDTKNGGIKEKLVRRDLKKFEKELSRNSKARAAAYSQINELEDKGKAFNLANAYSWMDRFKILADVAFYSQEYETAKNIVKQQLSAGYLSPGQAANIEMIEEQVEQKKKAYNFSEYKFRDFGEGLTPYTKARDEYVKDEYGALERVIGSGWERLTHLRNPLQVKLYHNTDALEEYERNVVYGKTMRMWQHPIEDYAKTYIYTGIGVDNPAQGAASWATAGYFLGGLPLAATMSVGGAATGLLNQTLGIDYVPERAEDVREMINQTDAVKYLRYRSMYDQTGDEGYLRQAANTMTGKSTSGDLYAIGQLGSGMGKPDRDYMEDIINNITRTSFRRATSILPEVASATIYSSIGMKAEAQGIMNEYATLQGDRKVPELDSPVYDRNIPIESTIINTYEMKGLNAHDAGYGWYDQVAQMERMKSMGQFSDTSLYGSFMSKVQVKDAVRSLDKTQEIKKSIMAYARSVEVFDDGMDRVEVEIVMR